ncbi:hypothetical protein N9W41_00215 [bacterium]|nr:hypothetical protein [bacterium]
MKSTIKGILTVVSLLAIASFITVGCAKDKSNNNPYAYNNGYNNTYPNNYNNGYTNPTGLPGQIYDSAIGYENNGYYEMELLLDVMNNGPINQTGTVQQGQVSVQGSLFIFKDTQLCKLPVGSYMIQPTNQVNYTPGFINGLSLIARHQSGEEIRIEIPSALLISTSQTYFNKSTATARRQYSKVLSALGFSISRTQYNCSDVYSVSTPF